MKEDTGMRDFSYREKAMQRNQELFHLREQAAMLEHARNRLDQLVFQQQELREKARQLDALRVKESNASGPQFVSSVLPGIGEPGGAVGTGKSRGIYGGSEV